MKPFNIKIQVAEQEVTLTISPYNQDRYRVIYFGGILGALKYHKSTKKWELLPFEEAIGDDLPPYTRSDDDNHIEIALNTDVVEDITREIVKHVSF
jgi:predicted RNA-binding protein with PUA domain